MRRRTIGSLLSHEQRRVFLDALIDNKPKYDDATFESLSKNATAKARRAAKENRLEERMPARQREKKYRDKLHLAWRVFQDITPDIAKLEEINPNLYRWVLKRRQHDREKSIRRYVREAGQSPDGFTYRDWILMQEAFNHTCSYCGVNMPGKMTMDHVIPLKQGGKHTSDNIVPACRRCNGIKSDKPVEEFLRSIGK
jgi:5-methylcytosine-specific restriction endonuclease McrA